MREGGRVSPTCQEREMPERLLAFISASGSQKLRFLFSVIEKRDNKFVFLSDFGSPGKKNKFAFRLIT